MKTKHVAVLFALSVAAQLASAGEIPDSVVEKALSVTGVKHTSKTRNQQGMTFSDVTYVDGGGNPVLSLRLGTPSQYDLWKSAVGAAGEPVAGVGSDAFAYKGALTLCAKSGKSAACMTPMPTLKGPKVTAVQVQELLKQAL